MTVATLVDKLRGQVAEIKHRTSHGTAQHRLVSEWADDLCAHAEEALASTRTLHRQTIKHEIQTIASQTRLPQEKYATAITAYKAAAIAIKGISDNSASLLYSLYMSNDQLEGVELGFAANPRLPRHLAHSGAQRKAVQEQMRQGKHPELIDMSEACFNELRPFFAHHRNSVSHGKNWQGITAESGILTVKPEATPAYVPRGTSASQLIKSTLEHELRCTTHTLEMALEDTATHLQPPNTAATNKRRSAQWQRWKRIGAQALLAGAFLTSLSTHLAHQAAQERYERSFLKAEELSSTYYFADDVLAPDDPLVARYERREMSSEDLAYFEEYLKAMKGSGGYVRKATIDFSRAFRPESIPDFERSGIKAKWDEKLRRTGTGQLAQAYILASKQEHEDSIKSWLHRVDYEVRSKISYDQAAQDENIFGALYGINDIARRTRDPILIDVIRAAAVNSFVQTDEKVDREQVNVWMDTIRAVTQRAERTQYAKTSEYFFGQSHITSFRRQLEEVAGALAPGRERAFFYYLENHTPFYKDVAEHLQLPQCWDFVCGRDLWKDLEREYQKPPVNFRQHPLQMIKVVPDNHLSRLEK